MINYLNNFMKQNDKPTLIIPKPIPITPVVVKEEESWWDKFDIILIIISVIIAIGIITLLIFQQFS